MKNFFKKPVVITLLALAVLAGIYGLQLGLKIYGMLTNPRPNPTVSTAVAESRSWNESFNVVGSLRSPYGSLLRAEVPGRVIEIVVEPGSQVSKGDLLLVIDAQSERARADLAKLTYERAQALREKNVNTQNDLDQAKASYEEALADLAKKEIRAPFDGEVGVPAVYLGEYVTPGDPLVSVEDLSMMNADFSVPQRDAGLLKVGRSVRMHVDAYDEEFEGVITGIDPRVDQGTRNIMVRASFDNPEGKLLSGMFASLEVVLDNEIDALVLPSTSVVYSAYGEYVYKIALEGDDKKAETVVKQIFVQTGDRIGDYVAILSGLEEGDEVVTVGQMKLRNGIPVQIDNSDTPAMSMNPTPEES